MDGFGQMGFHRSAVLFRSQIQDKVCLGGQLAGQTIAPELVQVPKTVRRQLGLHLQAVGGHAIEGPQQAVEAREDAQMFPEVVQVGGLHHAGGHVAVLDALVGDDRRGEAAAQVQLL